MLFRKSNYILVITFSKYYNCLFKYSIRTMTNPNLNQDINRFPLPKLSPTEMFTNCRFKPGQIVRLRSRCGEAKKGSIGIIDYYLPKNFNERGACWVRFYDTFDLNLRTGEEPETPDLLEIVYDENLDPCKHLPSWLPYELNKATGEYKLDPKRGRPVIKKLNRLEKLFRNTVTRLEQLKKGL